MFNNSTSTVALCHDDGLFGLETSSEKECEFSEPLTCQAFDTERERVFTLMSALSWTSHAIYLHYFLTA